MIRARRRFDQLPAMTILLLVFLATLPVLKVSSSTDTAGNRGDAPANVAPQFALTAEPVGPTGASTALPVVAPDSAAVSRPVAQLIPPPDGLQAVTFTLGDSDAKQPQSGGALLVASGEYTISGHSVMVSTFRADTAGRTVALGTQSVALADGTPAWTTAAPLGKAPNQVALLRDGLIVTLTGDLPVDDLASLASRIVVRW